jgi:hypothetical protein
MQLLNISNTSGGSFLNDRAGNYLTNYNKNDAGNWIIFTPFDESGVIIDAIVPVEADANDPVISSAYYNLQGIRIQQPVIGTVHIRIDTHASRKTTATKILLAR